MTDSASKWPALMAYIHDRNKLEGSAAWCGQLRKDEAAASDGEFADVARELEAAQAAYGAVQRAAGKNEYPYNEPMGRFLGLDINPGNNEPRHGYYMAVQLLDAFKYGEARRATEALIAEGKPLKIVAARDKKTREPIRFYTFSGAEQIQIHGRDVICLDKKRRINLSSNWSVSSCIQAVRKALESGRAYGT